jgi:NAD(P)-dependent dehydrogenase (short-subunit alcohol dehydrogenase family)
VLLTDLPTSNGVEKARGIGLLFLIFHPSSDFWTDLSFIQGAHFAPADVTSEEEVKAVFDSFLETYGRRPNTIVNCAGYFEFDFSINLERLF